MSSSAKRHMVVVSRLPAPYREPLFQRISELPDVRLTVLYETLGREGTAWRPGETGLESRFTYAKEHCHRSYRGGLGAVWDHLQSMRWCARRLGQLRPDLVVIHGYSYPAAWAAIRWCWQHGVRYALRSDSNGYIESVKGVRRWLKRWFLTRLVAKAHAILCIGSANRLYWTKYGAKDSQLVDALYAVDQELFCPATDGGASRREFRRRHGLEGKTVFLFVGRLIARKNLDKLLRAYAELRSRRQDVALVIAGDGPERPAIERLKWELELGADVVDLGRTEYTALPDVYRASDVLVCPYEREPWGLTVNEAMACGIPVIASVDGTCGAAVDLVKEAITGIELKELSLAEILRGMEQKLEAGSEKEWANGCAAMMETWNHRSTAEGFVSVM